MKRYFQTFWDLSGTSIYSRPPLTPIATTPVSVGSKFEFTIIHNIDLKKNLFLAKFPKPWFRAKKWNKTSYQFVINQCKALFNKWLTWTPTWIYSSISSKWIRKGNIKSFINHYLLTVFLTILGSIYQHGDLLTFNCL